MASPLVRDNALQIAKILFFVLPDIARP